MLDALFYAWERRLAARTTTRVVRPFDWGVDWIPEGGRDADAADAVRDWVSAVMADTDAFFTAPPTSDYKLTDAADAERQLAFPSALTTPHPDNNTVWCRYF